MYCTSTFSRVTHGFFTRKGGVSAPPFDTLNLALRSGESPTHVERNRQKVLEFLNCTHKKLVILNQVHSNKAIIVHQPWLFNTRETPAADAMITQNPNIVLGILTADCLPILLHDPINHTIAAVHAGWRGLVSGIIDNTVSQMVAIGSHPSHIVAAIGPCIHQDTYEVGLDVHDAFSQSYIASKTHFKSTEQAHKYLFDLPGAAIDILKNLGIQTIESLNRNTYAEPENFFSCRRSFHNGESGFGCQVSVITL